MVDYKAKTKNRNFYVYYTELVLENADKERRTTNWSDKRCKDVQMLISLIVELDIKKRTKRGDENNPWTMALENMQNDNIISNFLEGYFISTENGIHTYLLDRESLERLSNPKELTQNETMQTAFSLRFKDGMFILGEYQGNIASARRIAEYFNYFLIYFKENRMLVTDIAEIRFHHKIDQGFIDKINGFERVNSVEIGLEMLIPNQPQQDAFSTLANEVSDANIGRIVLTLMKKDKNGICSAKIKDWLIKCCDNWSVNRGKLKGKACPGHQSEVSLTGINVKKKCALPVGTDGEVFLTALYEVMEKMNEEIELLVF